jgi:hypothetical protein
VSYWAPAAPTLALIVGLVKANNRYEIVPLIRPGNWSESHTRIVAGCFLLVVAVFVVCRVIFNPPPFDKVRVAESTPGQVRVGRLVAQSNGMIYLTDERASRRGERDIIAVPLAHIESVRISKGSWGYRRTVPELLGVRFWRFSPDRSGKWRFERSSIKGTLIDQLLDSLDRRKSP